MTAAKLRPEVKTAWLNALRSGDYQQGKRLLHYVSQVDGGEKFCCLGVLCDLAVKAGEIEVTVEEVEREFHYDQSAGMPPESVTRWAFGEYDDGEWCVRIADDAEHETTLPGLNDTEEYTFEQIADRIEADL